MKLHPAHLGSDCLCACTFSDLLDATREVNCFSGLGLPGLECGVVNCRVYNSAFCKALVEVVHADHCPHYFLIFMCRKKEDAVNTVLGAVTGAFGGCVDDVKE